MKKKFSHYRKLAKKYHFLTVDISEGDEEGYQAVIPKFPGMYIFADTPQELREVVLETIAEAIEYLEKNGSTVPVPDPKRSSFSGKFVLRIDPDLHQRLTYLAQAEEKTLNGYINTLLEEHGGSQNVLSKNRR